MSFVDQSTYQVRAEWGEAGFARLAPADVVVVVDGLGFASFATNQIAAGGTIELADAEGSAEYSDLDGVRVALAAVASGAVTIAGCLRNAKAVAQAVMEIQHERQARTSIAIIACGVRVAADSDAVRFAVEDQLAAGAIISALSDLGIDHTAPDAAVMGESYRALSRATAHLVLASGTGRALAADGHRDVVVAAATADAVDVVPIVRDGAFVTR